MPKYFSWTLSLTFLKIRAVCGHDFRTLEIFRWMRSWDEPLKEQFHWFSAFRVRLLGLLGKILLSQVQGHPDLCCVKATRKTFVSCANKYEWNRLFTTNTFSVNAWYDFCQQSFLLFILWQIGNTQIIGCIMLDPIMAEMLLINQLCLVTYKNSYQWGLIAQYTLRCF